MSAMSLYPAQHTKTIAVGKPDVEDDQRTPTRFQAFEATLRGNGSEDRVAFKAEIFCQYLGQIHIIFDQQNAFRPLFPAVWANLDSLSYL
jgi:hypothetical protein